MLKKIIQHIVFAIDFIGLFIGVPYLMELLCKLLLDKISSETWCNMWLLLLVANMVVMYRLHKK